jgi:hypothetical protein
MGPSGARWWEPQITPVSNSQILWKNRRLGCFLTVNQRTDGLRQGPPPPSAYESPPILRLAFMAAGSRPAAWLTMRSPQCPRLCQPLHHLAFSGIHQSNAHGIVFGSDERVQAGSGLFLRPQRAQFDAANKCPRRYWIERPPRPVPYPSDESSTWCPWMCRTIPCRRVDAARQYSSDPDVFLAVVQQHGFTKAVEPKLRGTVRRASRDCVFAQQAAGVDNKSRTPLPKLY